MEDVSKQRPESRRRLRYITAVLALGLAACTDYEKPIAAETVIEAVATSGHAVILEDVEACPDVHQDNIVQAAVAGDTVAQTYIGDPEKRDKKHSSINLHAARVTDEYTFTPPASSDTLTGGDLTVATVEPVKVYCGTDYLKHGFPFVGVMLAPDSDGSLIVDRD